MGKRILLAEDDEDIRTIVEILLINSGYDVKCFSDAHFLNHLDYDALPDLFIFDRWLGSSDSFSICHFLKSKELTSNIPILILSADPAARQLYKSAKAEAFLEKPFGIDPFLNQIAFLLNTSVIDNELSKSL